MKIFILINIFLFSLNIFGKQITISTDRVVTPELFNELLKDNGKNIKELFIIPIFIELTDGVLTFESESTEVRETLQRLFSNRYLERNLDDVMNSPYIIGDCPSHESIPQKVMRTWAACTKHIPESEIYIKEMNDKKNPMTVESLVVLLIHEHLRHLIPIDETSNIHPDENFRLSAAIKRTWMDLEEEVESHSSIPERALIFYNSFIFAGTTSINSQQEARIKKLWTLGYPNLLQLEGGTFNTFKAVLIEPGFDPYDLKPVIHTVFSNPDSISCYDQSKQIFMDWAPHVYNEEFFSQFELPSSKKSSENCP